MVYTSGCIPQGVHNGVYLRVYLRVYLKRETSAQTSLTLWEDVARLRRVLPLFFPRFTVGGQIYLPSLIPVSLLADSSGPYARLIPVSLLVDVSCSCCYSRFTVGEELHPVITRFTVGAPSYVPGPCPS